MEHFRKYSQQSTALQYSTGLHVDVPPVHVQDVHHGCCRISCLWRRSRKLYFKNNWNHGRDFFQKSNLGRVSLRYESAGLSKRLLQPIFANLAHALLGISNDVRLLAKFGVHDFRPVWNRENRAREKRARWWGEKDASGNHKITKLLISSLLKADYFSSAQYKAYQTRISSKEKKLGMDKMKQKLTITSNSDVVEVKWTPRIRTVYIIHLLFKES